MIFDAWAADFYGRALKAGVPREVLDREMAGLTPDPRVASRDSRQPEFSQPISVYIKGAVTDGSVVGGERRRAEVPQLSEIEQRYGVPREILIAIWARETGYGAIQGDFDVIRSMASLAAQGRRRDWAEGELIAALKIIASGEASRAQLKGSWAGAMGQTQFMPSSYLKYAEDFDGDGKRDIWSTPADVFASIANYLKGHGWAADQDWGREVAVTPAVATRIASDVAPRSGSCQATRNMSVPLPLSRWQELGIRLPRGKALPKSAETASLVSGSSRHFLVDANYDAILEYNCAHSYAITVALLGDAIASNKAPAASKASKSTPKPKPRRRR